MTFNGSFCLQKWNPAALLRNSFQLQPEIHCFQFGHFMSQRPRHNGGRVELTVVWGAFHTALQCPLTHTDCLSLAGHVRTHNWHEIHQPHILSSTQVSELGHLLFWSRNVKDCNAIGSLLCHVVDFSKKEEFWALYCFCNEGVVGSNSENLIIVSLRWSGGSAVNVPVYELLL